MRLLDSLAKLRGRSLAELRERAAQRAAIMAERAGWRDEGEMTDEAFFRRLAWGRASSRTHAAVAGALRGGSRPALVPGLDDLSATLAIIRERWPDRTAELVREADEIVDGRFSLLGHPTVHLPNPVPWSRDFTRDVMAPDVHWSRIAYLDPTVAGDHKVVWELNRHQFLVTLGQAYALTRREAYATRAAQLMSDWLDANPPKRGVNWASSLEVAFRAIAWTWAMRLMAPSYAFTDALLVRWLKAIEVSARHLERYLSTWFSPNTHLTGEALGLLYIGTQFSELAAAPRWRDRGWSILLGQLQRHVRPDGTYFEQSTHYHRYTVDIYLHARLLGSAHTLPDIARIDEAIGRLATFLAWVARADGTVPLFGDEDGGRLLFLDARACDDARSPLATAAVLLHDHALAHAGAPPTDELAWLLGAGGVAAFDRLAPRPPAEAARAFPDGGFFVMRDGWQPGSAVLTVDCGPLGADNGGHAHADTLAFDLAIGERPVFVDAGTISYTTSLAERDLMRSTLVHNTVSLDGRSSSEPAGPFRWAVLTPGVLDAWHASPVGTLFEGHHDGYGRLDTPARHRRLIVAVRHSWWVVRDVVESEGRHQAVATFQCAAGLDAAVEGNVLRVSDDGSPVVTVHALGVVGRWIVDQGVASRRYGARPPGCRVRFAFTTEGRTVVTFVIARGAGPAPGQVGHERIGLGEVVRVVGAAERDLLMFGPVGTVDGIRSDARVAWVRRRASDGAVESVVAIGGTTVELDGARVAERAGGPVTAMRDGEGWHVERTGALCSCVDQDAGTNEP